MTQEKRPARTRGRASLVQHRPRNDGGIEPGGEGDGRPSPRDSLAPLPVKDLHGALISSVLLIPGDADREVAGAPAVKWPAAKETPYKCCAPSQTPGGDHR